LFACGDKLHEILDLSDPLGRQRLDLLLCGQESIEQALNDVCIPSDRLLHFPELPEQPASLEPRSLS
jgi:hypothetical protein